MTKKGKSASMGRGITQPLQETINKLNDTTNVD